LRKKNFFVLRNNDLGDVLVATPLIGGLKEAFPESNISMGVGDWARPLLENNPYLDEIISCNAPWHNKQNCRFPANSTKTFLEGLLYVLFSREARYISGKNFTHGIDVLGSRQGSWLLRRANIPNRYGVKGYAGGDYWCNHCIPFQENKKVAEAALRFLPLLGSDEIIEPRPKIFLHDHEKSAAESYWGSRNPSEKRVLIAPGGGFPEKCWGDENYTDLSKLLLANAEFNLCIVGSEEDKGRIKVDQTTKIKNFCGKLSLRQSAALVSSADFVITNTSLCMHLAGAFRIPSLTLLGDWYNSASLHYKQWGYPEGTIAGREVSNKIKKILSVNEAYKLFEKLINTKVLL
jgi:ADP-heptose:LPS heptosyltransferase